MAHSSKFRTFSTDAKLQTRGKGRRVRNARANLSNFFADASAGFDTSEFVSCVSYFLV